MSQQDNNIYDYLKDNIPKLKEILMRNQEKNNNCEKLISDLNEIEKRIVKDKDSKSGVNK